MDGAWISRYGNPTQSPLSAACSQSFDDAVSGTGKMDNGVYLVAGFCGRKFRLFLNNLIPAMDDPRYLEIGVFGGATLCAAIEGNAVNAVGVDDWSWERNRKTKSYRGFTKASRFTSPRAVG